MESRNTPEELDAAIDAICKMRGIERVEREEASSYYKNQKRLRDMYPEHDCGSVYLIEIPGAKS